MGLLLTDDVSPAALARFDMIIDVRSPTEYKLDHIPGAVNLPVLSDAERAEVGTIYVQESRFTARRIGAAYVAANVGRHLQTALADQGGAFQPLIYCWRGGMRSNSMAIILDQVGWRTSVLNGGYRTYRRDVTNRLYDGTLPHRFVLLDGQTGSGKTELLGLLADRGLQTLDLEGLAAHRGSLFGAMPGREQPGQKLFESRLLGALDALDPARVVVAEAESSKIGDRMIPPALWTRLAEAPRVELAAEPEARAAYLVRAYADVTRDPAALDAILERLPLRISERRRTAWRGLARDGTFDALAVELLALHYDPAYAGARRKHGGANLGAVGLDPRDPQSLAAAADAVAAVVRDA